MRHVEGRRVIELRVMATPDDGQLVGYLREVFKDVRHLNAGLTTPPKGPLTREDPGGAGFGEFQIQIRKALRECLPGIFG
jgi:hypothetical protein